MIVTLLGTFYLYETTSALAPKPGQPPAQIFPALGNLFLRTPGNVTVYGYLPVMFMVLGSAALMIVVSWLTPAPSPATIEKYFPSRTVKAGHRPEVGSSTFLCQSTPP